MENEEIKTLEFTAEQAETHIVALNANLKRVKRSLENAEYKLEKAVRFNDKSGIRHFTESRDFLQKIVDNIQGELDVMRDLFGSNTGIEDNDYR